MQEFSIIFEIQIIYDTFPVVARIRIEFKIDILILYFI